MIDTRYEQWKPVVGYEGLYEVSTLGRVASVQRIVQRRNGTPCSVPEKILAHYIHRKKGTVMVSLSRDGKASTQEVAPLVLRAFKGCALDGQVCCHYNDVSTDNRLDNLRWDTVAANMHDRTRNGKHHAANQTHCIWGHEFTPENTGQQAHGHRRCLACQAERHKPEVVARKREHRQRIRAVKAFLAWPEFEIEQRAAAAELERRGMVTAQEVADRIGCGVHVVVVDCQRGVLVAQHSKAHHRAWLILPEDAEEYIEKSVSATLRADGVRVDLPGEMWKPIVDWEDCYEISNLGRVWSIPRLVMRCDGRSYPVSGRIIKPAPNKTSGHLMFIMNRAGYMQTGKVHQEVLRAFIGPSNGRIALHWNDIPADNRLENLRWGTYSDNQHDRVRNGIHHHASKTHCPQGHEYNADNTIVKVRMDRNGGTERICRVCRETYHARKSAS